MQKQVNNKKEIKVKDVDRSKKGAAKTGVLSGLEQIRDEEVEDKAEWRKRNRGRGGGSGRVHECGSGEGLRNNKRRTKSAVQSGGEREQYFDVGAPGKSSQLNQFVQIIAFIYFVSLIF